MAEEVKKADGQGLCLADEAGVESGLAAAGLAGGEVHIHAQASEHLDGVLAYFGVELVYKTGGEEGCFDQWFANVPSNLEYLSRYGSPLASSQSVWFAWRPIGSEPVDSLFIVVASECSSEAIWRRDEPHGQIATALRSLW